MEPPPVALPLARSDSKTSPFALGNSKLDSAFRARTASHNDSEPAETAGKIQNKSAPEDVIEPALRDQKFRQQCRSYVEEFCDAAGSERVDTARSTGSQPGFNTSGFLSAGGRVTFSRRAARLKKSQEEPVVFDPITILSSHPLFSKCSVEFLRFLHDHGGPRSRYCKICEPHVFVASEKQVGESMWIVHRGQLEVRRDHERIAMLNEHDCFGERVLLGLDKRYTTSLRTLTMSHLIEVSCAAFTQALMRFPFERRLFELTLRTYQSANPRPRVPKARPAAVLALSAGAKLQGMTKSPGGALSTQSSPRPSVTASAALPPITKSARPAVMAVSTATSLSRRNTVRLKGMPINVSSTDIKDEEFIEQVKKSLSGDSKRGFRLPNLASTANGCMMSIHDKEDNAHPEENRLDIGLLPPLGVMTALQKRLLQRQLELRVQARQRLRKAVRRFTTTNVASLKAFGKHHSIVYNSIAE